MFEYASYEGMEFGKAIHELFEKVSWIDNMDFESLIQEWHRTSPVAKEIKQKATEQFQQAVASAEVKHILSRPEGNIELWREKHFDIVLDDQWITGTFDRVTILRDSNGKALEATILDFKSNKIADDTEMANAVERYRSQLLLYGKALSRIVQLDSSKIKLKLLFIHPKKVYDLT